MKNNFKFLRKTCTVRLIISVRSTTFDNEYVRHIYFSCWCKVQARCVLSSHSILAVDLHIQRRDNIHIHSIWVRTKRWYIGTWQSPRYRCRFHYFSTTTMLRPNVILLFLFLFFTSCSTKLTTSSSTAIFEDSNVALTEALTTQGILNTVAGSRGFSANRRVYNIAATAVKLNATRGVIVDGAGNLYISSDSHQIFKVTASTGLITVVAGNGEFGLSGDGGQATSARLNYPRGMALDANGNLLVADQFNNRIRKISLSTGIISTFAGNSTSPKAVDNVAATNTKLNSPRDVAVDSSGNVYIADTMNFRVRKVLASNGFITAFAGNGKIPTESAVLGVSAATTSLCYPRGIALDKSGNVFITDSGYNSIFKVTASSGSLSLVSGANKFTGGYNGDDIAATTAFLNGPRDIALDATGNIFFADATNYRVRKITISSGIISTVAGGGPITDKICESYEYDGDGKDALSASLCYPDGIAVDASGNTFFCDSDHRVVRKVTYSPSTVATRAPTVKPIVSNTGSPTAAIFNTPATPSVSVPSAPASTPRDVSPTVGTTTPGSPSASVPSASAPSGVLPTAGTPGTPSAATPSAATPSAATPSAATPSAATPSAVTPSAATPSAGTPSAATPSAATPSAATPSAATPSAATPSAATPSAATPSAAAPTPSASKSSAPVSPSTTGSQSSSASSYAAGVGHLSIIFLSLLFILNLHRDG